MKIFFVTVKALLLHHIAHTTKFLFTTLIYAYMQVTIFVYTSIKLYRQWHGFECNLEKSCTSEFFKDYQNNAELIHTLASHAK